MRPPKSILICCVTITMATTSLASCSKYKDDEQSKYYIDATASILSGQDDKYKPNKVVYIENPKASPSGALYRTYRSDNRQFQLDEIFSPYILRKGFTVACAEDKTKDSVLVVLVQDGIYQTYSMHPRTGFIPTLCKSRTAQ